MSNGGSDPFRTSSAPSRNRSACRRRCCWTGSGACCARAARFSNQVAGDPFIELLERGALQQVGIAPGRRSTRTSPATPCRSARWRAHRGRLPVPGPALRPGVLTQCLRSTARRAARSHRPPRGKVLRRWPVTIRRSTRWNCDRAAGPSPTPGRPDHHATGARDDGCCGRGVVRAISVGSRPARRRSRPACWSAGGAPCRDARLRRFARIVLGTNDIDFRAGSAQRRGGPFLAARVAGPADDR